MAGYTITDPYGSKESYIDFINGSFADADIYGYDAGTASYYPVFDDGSGAGSYFEYGTFDDYVDPSFALVADVPEPSSLALIASGVVACGLAYRRRRPQSAA